MKIFFGLVSISFTLLFIAYAFIAQYKIQKLFLQYDPDQEFRIKEFGGLFFGTYLDFKNPLCPLPMKDEYATISKKFRLRMTVCFSIMALFAILERMA